MAQAWLVRVLKTQPNYWIVLANSEEEAEQMMLHEQGIEAPPQRATTTRLVSCRAINHGISDELLEKLKKARAQKPKIKNFGSTR